MKYLKQYKKMKTPITYYGGKQNLSKRIIAMIPEHKIYCEPFFGGGAVFFAKEKSELEVINDHNKMLINFYQVCQNRFDELQKSVSVSLHSESEFYRAKDIYNNRVESNEIEKAWALWILSRMCHAGSFRGGWKYCNGTAGAHVGKVLKNKREEFKTELHERLSEVQISCRDALKVIVNRDSKDTFFYLDPPYPGASQGHYTGYTENNLQDLVDMLSSIKGKFILSNYWTDTLRDAVRLNGWDYAEIEVTTHSGMNKRTRKSTEVMVFNYKKMNNVEVTQKTLFA